jgi:nitrite reductase/ring-hydroxylating ferredoxin subunit
VTGERALCRLDDLPPGAARGFDAHGIDNGLFAIRLIDRVVIYVNACPHLGVPLDWLPGRFLSADGQMIICATHGAEFRLADGMCLRGPCQGDQLTPVPGRVRDGWVMVPCEAGKRDQGETPAA